MQLLSHAILAATCLALSACGSDDEPEPHQNLVGESAVWDLDKETEVSSSSTQFTALVSRLDCNSGVTGEVFAPEVRTTAAEVIVTFSVAPRERGAADCQGNDWIPYEVTLEEPLGDRALVDGACMPGEEAATTSFCTPNARRFP